MSPLAWARNTVSRLRPWPARRERKAAIERAKGERERSEHARAHAVGVQVRLEKMARENHFAEVIAQEIIFRSERRRGMA